MKIEPDVMDNLITDEEWLWQMMLNFLTNACKYTDTGFITVQISIVHHADERAISRVCTSFGATEVRHDKVSTSASQKQLLFEVHDTGRNYWTWGAGS